MSALNQPPHDAELARLLARMPCPAPPPGFAERITARAVAEPQRTPLPRIVPALTQWRRRSPRARRRVFAGILTGNLLICTAVAAMLATNPGFRLRDLPRLLGEPAAIVAPTAAPPPPARPVLAQARAAPPVAVSDVPETAAMPIVAPPPPAAERALVRIDAPPPPADRLARIDPMPPRRELVRERAPQPLPALLARDPVKALARRRDVAGSGTGDVAARLSAERPLAQRIEELRTRTEPLTVRDLPGLREATAIEAPVADLPPLTPQGDGAAPDAKPDGNARPPRAERPHRAERLEQLRQMREARAQLRRQRR